MNAIFKYPGAKWRIAQWIVDFFHPHKSYLEPFGGSLAVLYNKPRSPIETVNDLDGDIVNLFRWIKQDPERLAREVYLTPYARQAYEEAFHSQKTETDSLQRAVNLLIYLEMGHGFRTTGEKVGWKNDVQGREKAYAVTSWCNAPQRIISAAERLRGVQIENRPAIDLIRRFNFKDVLIYIDPPYVLSTRKNKKIYRHEMSEPDHIDLITAAKAHKGPVLISGYDGPLYNELLKGWHREETTSMTQNNIRKGTEVLWMNFEPPGRQLNLSDCYSEEVLP